MVYFWYKAVSKKKDGLDSIIILNVEDGSLIIVLFIRLAHKQYKSQIDGLASRMESNLFAFVAEDTADTSRQRNASINMA